MFIDESRFIAMAKASYKSSGILFGNIVINSSYDGDNDGIFITDYSWGAWFDSQHISNRIKALIIELSGILPNKGECFSVSKDNPTPQMCLNETIVTNFENLSKQNVGFVVTPVVFKNYRLLQCKGEKEIVAIKDKYYSMIDFSNIDYDIEGEPGMSLARDTASGEVFRQPLYWINGICKFFICPVMIQNDVLKTLCQVDFTKTENLLDG